MPLFIAYVCIIKIIKWKKNMKKKDLLRVLEANELTAFYGGGYWVVENVNGVLTTFWVIN